MRLDATKPGPGGMNGARPGLHGTEDADTLLASCSRAGICKNTLPTGRGVDAGRIAFGGLVGSCHAERAAKAQRRPCYAIIALVPMASFFQQWMLGGPQAMVLDLDAGFRVLVAVFAIPGFLSRRVTVQATLAVAYALLFTFYISLVFVQMR